jgi:hypothetical protein
MECRLAQSSEPWSCQILLRIEKDEQGNRVAEVRELKFGGVIKDKLLLEDMLRRAQLAILNPSVASHRFVDFDLTSVGSKDLPLGSTQQLSFSENVVCLDICGPDVPNLSFIDLPGNCLDLFCQSYASNLD